MSEQQRQALVEAQLAAIRWLHAAAGGQDIDYWLFGGWAVDLHLGRPTRVHADVDVAVRARDLGSLVGLFLAAGWVEDPEPGADGWTTVALGAVRVDLAAVPDDLGLSDPEGSGWPPGSFGRDIAALGRTRARVVGRDALVADKAAPRDDEATAAKDRVDVEELLAER